MNKAILISTALILAALYFASSRKAPMSAQAAETRRTAFLIRFGVDTKVGVDWSGNIERMTAWQFDRMGEHFMGESFTARGAAPIKAFIQGTGPLASVTLVKNNRAIYTKPGEGPEMNFAYTDADAKPGDAYYYVRVQQKNGQIAWSSPIWVKYQ